MEEIIEVLNRAGDLVLLYGPDPEGCIRAAVYGRPDVTLPYYDTADSLLVEETVDAVQGHLNPGRRDADTDLLIEEWLPGKGVADARGLLYATAVQVGAGVV